VHTLKNGHDRLYKVKEVIMCETQCRLECEFVDYDGKIFGIRKESTSISRFSGTKKITQFEAYPLKFHEDSGNLRGRLLDRGRKFEAYRGTHFVAYEGVALGPERSEWAKYSINSRIMVDSAASIRYKMRIDLEPFDRRVSPTSRIADVTAPRWNRRPAGPNADEDCVDFGSPYNTAKMDAGKIPTVDPAVESHYGSGT
jgi:hypothetical protein